MKVQTVQIALSMQSLAANPDDQIAQVLLNRLIAQEGPTPVKLHHVPNWLRRSWLAACREHPELKAGTWGASSGSEVEQMISLFLARTNDGLYGFDHWGSTNIAGHKAFVTEPYRPLAEAPKIFRPLIDLMPHTVISWSPASYWGHGTIRVALFQVPFDHWIRIALNRPGQPISCSEGSSSLKGPIEP